MSRLFRNQLRIGLAPDRMPIAGRRRGMRRPEQTGTVTVEAASDPADWRAAVDALPAAVALSRLHRPEVEVVFSSHFVRYALLERNDALKGDEEWQGLARHRLETVHGVSGADWTVRVCTTAPAGARVACAAQTSLIDGVRAKLAECGASLASVQPNLMASFNAVRKEIGRESCWLVVRESGLLTIALLLGGTWRAIRTRRVDDTRRVPLAGILEREAALLALGESHTRSVLFLQDDFAVNRQDAQRVADWTLAGEGELAAGRDEPALVPTARQGLA